MSERSSWGPGICMRDMTDADLDAVMVIEQQSYEFPWTRGHFSDSMQSGYLLLVLCDEAGALVAYMVAMHGVEETHLLNLTVAPSWRRRGLAQHLLDDLNQHARRAGANQVWLEVRASNLSAQQLYLRQGYQEVGRRPRYYPAHPAPQGREDAVLMSLDLNQWLGTRP